MKKIKLLSLLLGATLLAACSSKPNNDLYYWGNYSDIVYSYYNEEGDYGKQEAALNQIISDAKNQNKVVAPGVYGHLGLVLLKQGKRAEANAALQEEKRIHPDSATFVDYLQRKK